MMLKRAFGIFLLTFYTLGTFCLPMGDFAFLQEIPEMYSRCKATEDKDISPLDFVTDHLLNIDGIFDKHDHGDEQKPHQPFVSHHKLQSNFSFVCLWIFTFEKPIKTQMKPIETIVLFVPSDFISGIFRPPNA
jgi:hypothetical protein